MTPVIPAKVGMAGVSVFGDGTALAAVVAPRDRRR